MDNTFCEMDSFTKGLMERTKNREEFLKKINNQKYNSGEECPFIKERDSDSQDKGTINELSTKTVPAQVANKPLIQENKENTIKFIDDDEDNDVPPPISLSGLKGLSALRRKRNDTESTEDKSKDSHGSDEDSLGTKPQVCTVHLKNDQPVVDPKNRIRSKLTRLAQSYNEWEDEGSTPSKSVTKSPKKVSFDNHSPKISYHHSPSSNSYLSHSPKPKLNDNCQTGKLHEPKKLWDQKILTSLEAYGFERSSPTRVSYEFNKKSESPQKLNAISNQPSTNNMSGVTKVVSNQTQKLNILEEETSKKSKQVEFPRKIEKNEPKKIFTLPQASPSLCKVDNDDPAILPLAARRALFEAKMRGDYIPPEKLNVAAKTKLFETNNVSKYSSEPEAKKSRYDDVKVESTEKIEEVQFKTKEVGSVPPVVNINKNDLNAHKSPAKSIMTDTSEEEEEIAICLPQPDVTIPTESVNNITSQEKESKKSNSSENLGEDDIAEALAAFKDIDEYSVHSLETNRLIENKVEENKLSRDDLSSSLSDVSSLIEHIGEGESPMGSSTRLYPELPQLDEAIHDIPTTQTKSDTPRTIFHLSPIKSVSREQLHQTKSVPVSSPVKTSTARNPSTPLRTLSMYRREQKVRAYQREKQSDADDDFFNAFQSEANMRELLKKYNEFRAQKVDELKREAEKYNNVIFQSMRAVELCVQINNVSERIEAEKILLINTARKKACVDEIYRLQNEDNIDVTEDPVGRVLFNKLTLLVKGDFFVSQANGYDLYEYHFICLFICGDKVIATDALSSTHAIQEASLAFNNKIIFEDLRKDFKIRLEVYALALPKGKHHHDKKFGTIGIRLTPKNKTKVKYTHSPALKASPGNEKIKCNFKQLGFVIFTRENCMRSRFELEKFMYTSPLEDKILIESSIGAKYDLSLKSYLNFHEHSGDLPVWNRRWCVLNGHLLYYWRFSEDEGNKQPLGVLSLKHCVNPIITKASTDLCMRPHSFAFVTLEKKDTSVVPIKHLMAADIRSERDSWLEKLNQVLQVTRFWEPDALQPFDQASLDRVMK